MGVTTHAGAHSGDQQPTTSEHGAAQQPHARAVTFGPMPGCNVDEALDILGNELSVRTIPYLPDGAGYHPVTGAAWVGEEPLALTSLLARTAGLLEGIGIDTGPRGLILRSAPTRLSARIARAHRRLMDALSAAWGTAGEHTIIPLIGSATLSYRLELPGGYSAITDAGARRDIGTGLEHLATTLIDEAEQRLGTPASLLIVDPAAPAAVAGTLPGATDFDTIRPIGADGMAAAWARLHDAARAASQLPTTTTTSGAILTGITDPGTWALARRAHLSGIWVPAAALTTTAAFDEAAAAADAGLRLGIGITQSGDHVDDDTAIPRQRAIDIAHLVDEMQLGREWMAHHTDVLPSAPLTGITALDAAHQLACAKKTAEMISRDAGDL